MMDQIVIGTFIRIVTIIDPVIPAISVVAIALVTAIIAELN
jgi:hypothetical protein